MEGGWGDLTKKQESIPSEFKAISHFLSWDSNVSQKLSVPKGSMISKIKENIFQKQHVKTRFPAPSQSPLKKKIHTAPHLPPQNINLYTRLTNTHTQNKLWKEEIIMR